MISLHSSTSWSWGPARLSLTTTSLHTSRQPLGKAPQYLLIHSSCSPEGYHARVQLGEIDLMLMLFSDLVRSALSQLSTHTVPAWIYIGILAAEKTQTLDIFHIAVDIRDWCFGIKVPRSSKYFKNLLLIFVFLGVAEFCLCWKLFNELFQLRALWHSCVPWIFELWY